MVIPHTAVLCACARQPRPIPAGVDNVSCLARPDPVEGWITAYNWHEVTRIMQCFKLVIESDDTRSFIVANLIVLGAPHLPNSGISFVPARIDVL